MRDVNHCNDWTEGSDTETGRMGSHITAATGWTERATLSPCDGTRRLYCLSDADILIFTDRFE